MRWWRYSRLQVVITHTHIIKNFIYSSEGGNMKMQHYVMVEIFEIASSYYSVGPIFQQGYKAYCQLIIVMNLIGQFSFLFFSFFVYKQEISCKTRYLHAIGYIIIYYYWSINPTLTFYQFLKNKLFCSFSKLKNSLMMRYVKN